MKAGPIIELLRANCPSFSNRVVGAAEFNEAFVNETALPVPHAFVITGFSAGEAAQTAGIVTQALRDEASVVLCVDNTADDNGYAGADEVQDLMEEIWPVLIGWVPATGYGGLQFEGGSLLDATRARLWYVADFYDSKIIGQT